MPYSSALPRPLFLTLAGSMLLYVSMFQQSYKVAFPVRIFQTCAKFA